jgi:hypothetical protein
MSRIAIAFVISILTIQAQAFQTTCDKYLKTYNVYEELIDAKVVERYSLFSVTDWSVDSQFEGIILTPEAPENPELRIQISTNKAKMVTVTKFEKWSMDERYRRADFDPIKAFANAGRARMFTVELRKGIQILCTETKEILTEN